MNFILAWLTPKNVGIMIVLLIILFVGYSLHHAGYKSGLVKRDQVQAEFDAFKLDQKSVAAIQAGIVQEKERIQNENNEKIKTEYQKAVADRDVALAKLGDYRLCAVEDMPREQNLPVAGSTNDPVRKEAASTSGIDETASLVASFTLKKAIADHDQCNALISWVCAQGMCSTGEFIQFNNVFLH
jgi:hypothetical protein